ncbi:MAG: alkaline phosphatase family protein [Tannerellaceae bacterium]|nr:alkaline phosphatase family protein [Tannerellaceae bacterium]
MFVIGIDGLSSDGLRQATTPHMDELIRNGAICNHVRTVQPSSSSANWASMLMGAGTEIHGITSNEWEFDDHELDPVVVNEWGYFPTILSVIKAQRPDAKTGILYHWDGFGRLLEENLASLSRRYSTEKEAAYAVADYIKREKPMFIFSQLDDVDAAGHTFGHMTDGYLQGIAFVDSLIGVIVEAVREAGIEKETLLFIVSDHGGINKGHGGTTWEEITVPFILSGAGIKKGYNMPTETYTFDVAPIITFALGLKEPYAWRGKAIKTAFEGEMEEQFPLSLTRLSAGYTHKQATSQIIR